MALNYYQFKNDQPWKGTGRFSSRGLFRLISVNFRPTAHLNEKNLSTNSPWGFEHVLDTMNYYWLCPDENFSPQSLVSRWRCDHFFKKWTKSKSDTTFTHKKTSVTPTFCKRNFSRMNRFGLMNFLSSTDPVFFHTTEDWFCPLFGNMIAAPPGDQTLRRKIFIWA